MFKKWSRLLHQCTMLSNRMCCHTFREETYKKIAGCFPPVACCVLLAADCCFCCWLLAAAAAVATTTTATASTAAAIPTAAAATTAIHAEPENKCSTQSFGSSGLKAN